MVVELCVPEWNKISGKILPLILRHQKSCLQLVKNLLKASALDSTGVRKKLRVCSTAENYIACVHKVPKFR